MKEIVFLGRGGQGGKTASLILAESLINIGLNVQAFSEYGPERSGAPVKSYIRFSKDIILTNSQIEEPDYLIVLDEGLLNTKDIVEFLSRKLVIIINSNKDPQSLNVKFNFLKHYKYFVIDCDKIAQSIYKKPIVNICILGPLVNILEIKNLTSNVSASITNKFHDKLNVKAYEQGLKKESIIP